MRRRLTESKDLEHPHYRVRSPVTNTSSATGSSATPSQPDHELEARVGDSHRELEERIEDPRELRFAHLDIMGFDLESMEHPVPPERLDRKLVHVKRSMHRTQVGDEGRCREPVECVDHPADKPVRRRHFGVNQPIALQPLGRFTKDGARVKKVLQACPQGDEIESVLRELGVFGYGHDHLFGAEAVQLDGPASETG